MTRHAITAALGSFWLAMAILLWRAETGLDHASSPVPLDLVVERILHASDPSQLRLLHHGREIGELRWVASIQERAPSNDASTPEGMVRVIDGYRLDVDLNLRGDLPDQRWRVLAQVEAGPDKLARDVLVRLVQRPKAWEIRLRAGSEAIEVVEEDGRSIRRSQSFKLSDLGRIREALGPLLVGLPLPASLAAPNAAAQRDAAPWVQWTATEGPLLAGRHAIRAFKVHARILGQFDATAHVSRAGELLRVALPDQYLLASTALPGMDASQGSGRRR